MRKDSEEEKRAARLLSRHGSYGDWMQEPEMAPNEPTEPQPARGIFIGVMIGVALWLAVALVLWVTIFGGL